MTLENNLNVVDIDALTGEITERPYNEDELSEAQLRLEIAEQEKNQKEAQAAARKSALAKLKKLGLTAEEIAAL